eukprot:scaffold633_cov288-Ochromonas_danica.AAC.16
MPEEEEIEYFNLLDSANQIMTFLSKEEVHQAAETLLKLFQQEKAKLKVSIPTAFYGEQSDKWVEGKDILLQS